MNEQNISNFKFQISNGSRRRVNALGIREVEPWPERVDGKELLDELADILRRFVVLPRWGAETLALWVLHTYAFELRDISTYIGIESPEKRCGKTTLLAVLLELVNRPVVAANISSPAFFRVIEEMRPTLLIDEADTFLQGNEELKGILNSGYSRSTAFVVRVANESLNSKSEIRNTKQIQNSNGETSKPQMDADGCRFFTEGNADESRAGGGNGQYQGKRTSNIEHPMLNIERGEGAGENNRISNIEYRKGERTPQRDGPYQEKGSRLASFSCWCPKVMAAIGRLPDTLADRCIVIRMQRKGLTESCERLRNLDVEVLRRKCARFVLDHEEEIALARPVIPEELNDRAADIWEPLLVLADLSGGNFKPRMDTDGQECLNPKSEIRSTKQIQNSKGENLDLGNSGMDTGSENDGKNGNGATDGPGGITDHRSRITKGWAEVAREAAVALNTVAQEANPIGQLLLDILIVFVKENAERVFSRTMVQWLNAFVNRPWAEMTTRRSKEARQGVTDVWLAKVLRPYGIRPATIRIGECTGKGYVKEDFMPVFQRYIPRSELEELKEMAGTKSPEQAEREKLVAEYRKELAECEAAGPVAAGRLKQLTKKLDRLG